MWQFSHSVTVKAKPQAIWNIWSKPQAWSEWDPDVKSCVLKGDFKEGTVGTLVPKGGPSVKFKLTEVSHHKSFTDVANLPLAKLIFEHDMIELEPGVVKVTHTVKITGLLSRFFAKVMGKQIAKGLPTALFNLSVQAENG